MAGLFRAKNLERISNPDNLDDYIRVSNPAMWIALVAVLLLLVAAIVWGICGTITESTPSLLIVDDGKAQCYIDETRAAQLQSGDEIVFQDASGMVTSVASAPVPIDQAIEETDEPLVAFQKALGDTEWLSHAAASIDLPDGTYEATVVLKVYAPFALFFGAS